MLLKSLRYYHQCNVSSRQKNEFACEKGTVHRLGLGNWASFQCALLIVRALHIDINLKGYKNFAFSRLNKGWGPARKSC